MRVAFPTNNIGTLHKWRPNLNNNTLYILSLVKPGVDVYRQNTFYVNVRLRIYKHCYSIANYAKRL